MRKLTLFFCLLSLMAYTSACIPDSSSAPPSPELTLPPTLSGDLEPDWFTVYFTDPDSPTAGTYRGGPDSALAEAILAARLSVDAAIYHLNLWSIRDALIAAHEAGVAVRLVVESDNTDEVEIQELQEAGIEILGDRRESLMHNKFVVIDKSEVWTGSMNFTVTGAYHNNNALVRIRSTRLAENFTAEFEEMFVRDLVGDNILPNTPHPILSVNGTLIETYFSPDDRTAQRIVELIRDSQSSIFFMAYSFTSDEIAEAMLERASEGVRVSGVFEEGQYYSNIGTEFDRLLAAGLDVHLDGNDRNMHHKVIIIDEAIVITGSYNFTKSAEFRNDENTLIFYNREIASRFLSEFERVYQEAVSGD